jgi:hypothetical protein
MMTDYTSNVGYDIDLRNRRSSDIGVQNFAIVSSYSNIVAQIWHNIGVPDIGAGELQYISVLFRSKHRRRTPISGITRNRMI